MFFDNIGTISLFAIVGTLSNALIFGCLLWGLAPLFPVDISLLECMVFGSLISAVDPVAVLSIFETVHVNETLDMIVFGESVLNDAVSIVLYNTFLSLVVAVDIQGSIVFLATAKFFIVAGGGLIIGCIFAFASSLFTRFTQEIHILESLIVVLFGLGSYVTAEIFSMSAIVAILFCGILQSRYTQPNLSNKSHTTVKFFMKSLALSAETVIFLQLGVQTIYHFFSHSTIEDENYPVRWDFYFIALSTFMIIPLRFILVVILSTVANIERRKKIMRREQFIMSYGGLRGAIAYALAYTLPLTIESKGLIITTTLVIILWTVFIQGGSINYFLNLLHVPLAKPKSLSSDVIVKSMEDVNHALKIIIGGYSGLGGWRHVWTEIDELLYKILVRGLSPEEKKIVQLFNKIQKAQVHEILQEDVNRMNELLGSANPHRLKYAPNQKLKEKYQVEWSSDSGDIDPIPHKKDTRMKRTSEFERFDIITTYGKAKQESIETRELRSANAVLESKIRRIKKHIRKLKYEQSVKKLEDQSDN